MNHVRDRRLADELADELMMLTNSQFYIAVFPTHAMGMNVLRQVASVLLQRDQNCTMFPGRCCIQNEQKGYLLFITPNQEEQSIRGRKVVGGYGLSFHAVEWMKAARVYL